MRDQLRDLLQLEGHVRWLDATGVKRLKGLEHENRVTQTDERDLSLENATLSKVIAKTALRPPDRREVVVYMVAESGLTVQRWVKS